MKSFGVTDYSNQAPKSVADGQTDGGTDGRTDGVDLQLDMLSLKLVSDCNTFCLFDLILYVPSTIFQLTRDGSSWVEPVLS